MVFISIHLKYSMIFIPKKLNHQFKKKTLCFQAVKVCSFIKWKKKRDYSVKDLLLIFIRNFYIHYYYYFYYCYLLLPDANAWSVQQQKLTIFFLKSYKRVNVCCEKEMSNPKWLWIFFFVFIIIIHLFTNF